MNMNKIMLKSRLEKIRLGLLRFPSTLLFLIGMAVLLFIQINYKDAKITNPTWVFASLGILLSIAIALFAENFKNFFVRIGLHISVIVLLAVYSFSLPQHFEQVHFYQVIILGIVFAISVFFVSFFSSRRDIQFWEFSKVLVLQFIITFVFTQVILTGLSLAILSLRELFRIDIQPEFYQNLAVVCYVLFAPIYFLSHVPDEVSKHDEIYSFPKFLKILGLNIVLPILGLYSLILYLYFIRIIIRWELPEGWVSWLVSILAFGGFLCMQIIYPLRLSAENKFTNLFSRFFPLLMLPLLVLMSIGIFRRFDDYGLTINRLYVLILNIWLYGVCIYLFVSRSNHLKWIVISFAAVALLVSVGPWSVYHITRRTMLAEIRQGLTDAHLLRNGRVIDNASHAIKVDSLTTVKLSGKIEYIHETYGSVLLQPFFEDSIQDMNHSELITKLGLDNSYATHPVRFYHASLQGKPTVNIAGYNYYVSINSHIENPKDTDSISGLSMSVKQHQLNLSLSHPRHFVQDISLKPLINKVLVSKREESEWPLATMLLSGKDYLLVVSKLHLKKEIRTDSISVRSIQGQLFLK